VSDNPLRNRAIEIRPKPGYKSRIDMLIDSLGADDQHDVLDLLMGEPLLPHSSVAQVLDETYGLIDGHKILDRSVMDWRRSKGVRLRSSKATDEQSS